MGGEVCQLSQGCVKDGRNITDPELKNLNIGRTGPSQYATTGPMPAPASSVPLQFVNLNQLALMALNSDKYHATYDKETHNVTNIKNIENDTTNVHEILNGHIVKGSQFT